MAGWTYSGNSVALGSAHGVDDGEKVTTIPSTITAGEAAWWPHFAWQVLQEYVQWINTQRHGTIATVAISANNGAGDTNGVGTLTITLVTV